jgi:C4-dicarboxylate-binding protein DctP
MKYYSLSKYLVGVLTVLIISCDDGDQSLKKAPSGKTENSKVYKLKFGHDMPGESPQHLAAKKFKEIVERKSQGRIQIEIFPNQVLGSDQEMILKAIEGNLDIILPPMAKLSPIVPASLYLDLPFFFEDRKELYEMLDGKPGKFLREQFLSKGLVGVAFWESGFKHFTANKEIHSPEDFINLKVRVMKNRLLADQYRLLGAKPFFIDFLKISEALKDGVINAQENSLVSIMNLKLYERQSHITLSEHGYIGYLLSFSKKTYDKLPQELQEILFSTGQEVTAFEREETLKKENDYLKKLQETKIKIIKLTSEEKKVFKTVLLPLLEKYRSTIGYKLLEITDQIRSEKIPFSDDEILIGLDADLFAGSSPSGYSIKRGAQIAINEINAAGGVLGKKMRLISKDHSGISARGIMNIDYFSKLKNLVAVIGGIHSPVALSELETLHQKKIIYLDPWAAATNIVENGHNPNYVFRVSVRDEYAGPFLVNEALKKIKRSPCFWRILAGVEVIINR